MFTESKFRKEVKNEIIQSLGHENQIITENDIKKLPELIQKYLRYVGVIGKDKVTSLRTVSEIDIDLGEKRGTAIMTAEEYNFFGISPSRRVLMKFKLNGIPVIGFDSYINKKGRMQMRVLDLIQVVDGKGHEMDDTSAATMLLLNMCIVAPATLLDDRIQWDVINDRTMKVTFTDQTIRVSGELEFNEAGELTNFSTEDKYYSPDGKSYEKIRWSTPVKAYQNINGLRLASYGEAIWHFPEKEYCYGKNTLKQLQYNVSEVM